MPADRLEKAYQREIRDTVEGLEAQSVVLRLKIVKESPPVSYSYGGRFESALLPAEGFVVSTNPILAGNNVRIF
jgi:hypothetical protein